MIKLAAIAGPTAAGKSEIALQVAGRIGGEIISCDSMQVYRGMDIGTAKVDSDMREKVPHHLIDVAASDGEFSVADYQILGREAIAGISSRGQIPLLVGGTGLYYQALVDDYDFVPLPNLKQVRQRLEEGCERSGLVTLYERLMEVDPDYAARISSNDRKRIIRALEVWEITGRAFSATQVRFPGKYLLAAAGLSLPRPYLYARINQRVDLMLAKGLIEEVERLKAAGITRAHRSMQALGYKQVMAFLDGEVSYNQMAEDIKKATRHYAKRQYTWFKKDDRIRWFDLDEETDLRTLIDKICDFMESVFISR